MRLTAMATFLGGLVTVLLLLTENCEAVTPWIAHGRINGLGKGLVVRPLRGGGEIEHSTPLPLQDTLKGKAGKLVSGSGDSVTVKISINYGLDNGVIVATGPSEAFGYGNVHKAPKLQRKGGELWELQVQVPLDQEVVQYQYVVLSKTQRFEALIAPRSLSVSGLAPGSKIDVQDAFRSPKLATLATSCFSRAIFGRGLQDSLVKTQNKVVAMKDVVWPASSDAELAVRFVVYAPRVEAGHSVWVTGNVESLGAWSASKCLPMVHVGSGLYVGQAIMKKGEACEYKYKIVDAGGNEVCKEEGSPRKIATDSGTRFAVKDEAFSYPTKVYKAAGVAIPVSGIKTSESTGIGEFLDLKKMVDWCTRTGLQLIQILPINDSGEDPSPYSASSSFALHPSYVRPSAVCDYYQTKNGVDMSGCAGWAKSLVDKLNKNWRIDHPKVLDEKRRLMDAIFDKVGQVQRVEEQREQRQC